MNNGIEEMVREYTEAMSDLSLLERQLATELQNMCRGTLLMLVF